MTKIAQSRIAVGASRPRWTSRILAAVVAAALAVSGVGAPLTASAQERAGIDGSPRGFAGPYLAARRALAENDLAAAALYFRRALRANPTDLRTAGAALQYSLIVGDVAAASRIAESVFGVQSRAGNAPLVIGAAAVREGRWSAASEAFASSGQPPILQDLLLGWVAFGAGDVEAAYGFFLKDVDARGKDVFGNEHAGHLAAALGDHAEAAAYFEASAEALGFWLPETALAAAAAHQSAGDAAAAGAVIDAALADAPGNIALTDAKARLAAGAPVAETIAFAQDGVAMALVGVGRFFDGEKRDELELSTVLAQLARSLAPDFDQAALLAGQRLLQLEQYDLAVDAFQATPADSFFIAEARIGRALATGGRGEEAKAIDQLSALIDSGAATARAHFALGAFAASQEQFARCAVAYEDGMTVLRANRGALERGDWFYAFRAGICRERNDEWEAAEAHFVAALELWPDQPDVLNYFGYSLVEQRRRYDEARAMIERAVAQKPTGHIVDSLGWVMWRTGDFDGAVRQLARALELEPNIYEINDHYGDALWMVGRRREAAYHWERALLFAPEDQEIVERIERKLEIGLDALLAEEGDAPPTPIGERSDGDAAAPSDKLNGG